MTASVIITQISVTIEAIFFFPLAPLHLYEWEEIVKHILDLAGQVDLVLQFATLEACMGNSANHLKKLDVLEFSIAWRHLFISFIGLRHLAHAESVLDLGRPYTIDATEHILTVVQV